MSRADVYSCADSMKSESEVSIADLQVDAIFHCCLVAASCPTLCNPTDCSPPGSSVHGVSQERILERVAIFSSRGSS